MSGETNPVLAEIQREIKSFGEDTKKLGESLQKDLADVRKIAEEAKGNSELPEIKSQIEALTTSVAEKQDALDAKLEEKAKALDERADALETAMNRSRFTGEGGGQDEAKHALEFFEAKAARAGNLDWRNRPAVDTIDMDGYKLWAREFQTYLRAKDDREVESKALSIGSNPDGGYLVPTAMSSRIIQKVYETSPLRQLATVETIGGSELEIPIDTDEAAYGWVGEEETRGETGTPQVGIQRISVHEMYAKPKATQRLLEDASIDMEAWLARKVADRFARVEATGFISGNGVNKPRGILTYTAGSAGARGTIKQVASGHATTLTADVIVKMPFEIKSAYLANASWLMKRSSVQAVMLMTDGQDQYLWRPGLAEGQPSTLGGYPVRQADDMPAVGAGELPVAFGDFRAGYTVVDRLGITTLRDPFSAKPFVEFYSRKRVGGDVVDFEAFALVVVSA
jgi:HK97 family phage major capsid protein